MIWFRRPLGFIVILAISSFTIAMHRSAAGYTNSATPTINIPTALVPSCEPIVTSSQSSGSLYHTVSFETTNDYAGTCFFPYIFCTATINVSIISNNPADAEICKMVGGVKRNCAGSALPIRYTETGLKLEAFCGATAVQEYQFFNSSGVSTAAAYVALTCTPCN